MNLEKFRLDEESQLVILEEVAREINSKKVYGLHFGDNLGPNSQNLMNKLSEKYSCNWKSKEVNGKENYFLIITSYETNECGVQNA